MFLCTPPGYTSEGVYVLYVCLCLLSFVKEQSILLIAQDQNKWKKQEINTEWSKNEPMQSKEFGLFYFILCMLDKRAYRSDCDCRRIRGYMGVNGYSEWGRSQVKHFTTFTATVHRWCCVSVFSCSTQWSIHYSDHSIGCDYDSTAHWPSIAAFRTFEPKHSEQVYISYIYCQKATQKKKAELIYQYVRVGKSYPVTVIRIWPCVLLTFWPIHQNTVSI